MEISNIWYSASGPNTLAAFKANARNAQQNVGPSGVSSRGGELFNATSTSPSGSPTGTDPATNTGAAAALHPNTFAVTGVLGMFAYLLL